MKESLRSVRLTGLRSRGTLSLLLAVLVAGMLLGGCGLKKLQQTDESLGLDTESSPGDLYVAMAVEYLRLGQPDAALRRAMQALEEDDDNPRSHYVMALVLQSIGENDRAEKSFKRAVELSPNNPDIRNAYGTFFCKQGRYREANAQFSKALESPLYTTPWVAMTNSGMCAAKTGNLAQAETDFRRALDSNPRFGLALVKMADIEYNRRKYKAAKEYLDRFFRTNLVTAEALALGYRTERRLGHKKTAATYKMVLRKRFPDAPQSLEL